MSGRGLGSFLEHQQSKSIGVLYHFSCDSWRQSIAHCPGISSFELMVEITAVRHADMDPLILLQEHLKNIGSSWQLLGPSNLISQ